MRKKTIITRDNLLKMYPRGPFAMSNNLHINGGVELRIGGDFKNFTDYSLRRLSKVRNSEITNTHAFDSGPVGFYEVKHLTNITNNRYIMLPSEYVTEVEVEAIIDVITPVLEKFMKGRYYIKTVTSDDYLEYIYLYYPEFTITNTIGESHLIKDMVIELRTTEEGIHPQIYGKRFSFTKQELAFGYSHSHLSTQLAESSSFSDFCLGNTSTLRKYLNVLADSCTADQFELLLVQIEQYLIWESIEGNPYISISKLFTNNQSETPATIDLGSRSLVIKMFMEKLTPEVLFAVDDYTYVLNTTTGVKELFRIEQEVTKEAITQGILREDKLYDFDLSTESYQANHSGYSRYALPSNLTSSENADIRNALKITPHLYHTQELKPLTTTIKRIGSTDLTCILQRVNELLTYGHRINGQNNISSESKNINNGEVTVTGNNPTQSVSNQQRVVGAVAI